MIARTVILFALVSGLFWMFYWLAYTGGLNRREILKAVAKISIIAAAGASAGLVVATLIIAESII